MWQRLHTLYLAIASILVGSLFFCRLFTSVSQDGVAEVTMYYEYLPFLLFLISLLSANVIALFSYKSRMLQLRVCVLAALLLLGFQIWLVVYFIKYRSGASFSITAVFPIVAAILDVLAAKSIMVDEAMVQSSSRIRSSRKGRRK